MQNRRRFKKQNEIHRKRSRINLGNTTQDARQLPEQKPKNQMGNKGIEVGEDRVNTVYVSSC